VRFENVGYVCLLVMLLPLLLHACWDAHRASSTADVGVLALRRGWTGPTSGSWQRAEGRGQYY
jgi:hypothetical protein